MRDRNRGDELERVLSTHAAALARLAASYESRPALREELLQDIAFAIWRALPSFRHESSEKTFVMRIATNRALSHLAARPPAADGLDAAEGLADTMPRPDELAARMETAARLQGIVRNLAASAPPGHGPCLRGTLERRHCLGSRTHRGQRRRATAPWKGAAQGCARRNDMTDRDIERWTAEWRAGAPPVADLARLARRESRQIGAWIALDWIFGAGLLAFADLALVRRWLNGDALCRRRHRGADRRRPRL